MPVGSQTGGVYDVNEMGLEFRHMQSDLPTPKNGEEFLVRLRQNFRMKVLERPSPNELVFEMVGVDVSFANAIRRILLSEVPTVAIENVYMWNNSSIVHDEVLAHRLGLVPINVDPRLFDELHEGDDPTDRNTVVFRLAVSCDKKEEAKKDSKVARRNVSVTGNTDLDEAAETAAAKHFEIHSQNIETPGRPYTKHVYSRDFEWVPQGDQESRFPDGIRPVHEDILLAKLRPGQVIELEAHARRGTGRDHAKFSPVATASYRLMPHIEVLRPIYDKLAEKLVHVYEPGVFRLVKCGPEDGNHDVKAELINPYACTMSRNFMQDRELKESIRMSRVPNHFIFQVESVGMLSPAVLVSEALSVLHAKCHNLIHLAEESTEIDR